LICCEIFKSSQRYLKDLEIVVSHFMIPLYKQCEEDERLYERAKRVFSVFEPLVLFTREVVEEMETTLMAWPFEEVGSDNYKDLIKSILSRMDDMMDLYSLYLRDYSGSLGVLRHMMEISRDIKGVVLVRFSIVFSPLLHTFCLAPRWICKRERAD